MLRAQKSAATSEDKVIISKYRRLACTVSKIWICWAMSSMDILNHTVFKEMCTGSKSGIIYSYSLVDL